MVSCHRFTRIENKLVLISSGCDFDTCFSDTWAMDLSAALPQWFLLVNSTISPLPIPEARFTAAGGVYPGSDQLWLSMGESISGRKLSDTWVLQINETEGSLTGKS